MTVRRPDPISLERCLERRPECFSRQGVPSTSSGVWSLSASCAGAQTVVWWAKQKSNVMLPEAIRLNRGVATCSAP